MPDATTTENSEYIDKILFEKNVEPTSKPTQELDLSGLIDFATGDYQGSNGMVEFGSLVADFCLGDHVEVADKIHNGEELDIWDEFTIASSCASLVPGGVALKLFPYVAGGAVAFLAVLKGVVAIARGVDNKLLETWRKANLSLDFQVRGAFSTKNALKTSY